MKALLLVHIDLCFVTELNYSYYIQLHHFSVSMRGDPCITHVENVWILHHIFRRLANYMA